MKTKERLTLRSVCFALLLTAVALRLAMMLGGRDGQTVALFLGLGLLPDEWYGKLMRYERWGMLLLTALLLAGVLDTPLGVLRDGLTDGLFAIGTWPFDLLMKFSA